MRTPRFAPALLAALLLAGCTAPAGSESTASAEATPAAESAETAEEAAATASTEPLRLLQTGDEKQYYLTEPANADQTHKLRLAHAT